MDTKMDKKTVKSDDSEINKYKFYQNKSPILIRNLDISKIVVSNKLPFGKKSLNLLLVTKILEKLDQPQMIKCKISFDANGRIYFLIKKEKVFIKYVEIFIKLI